MSNSNAPFSYMFTGMFNKTPKSNKPSGKKAPKRISNNNSSAGKTILTIIIITIICSAVMFGILLTSKIINTRNEHKRERDSLEQLKTADDLLPRVVKRKSGFGDQKAPEDNSGRFNPNPQSPPASRPDSTVQDMHTRNFACRLNDRIYNFKIYMTDGVEAQALNLRETDKSDNFDRRYGPLLNKVDKDNGVQQLAKQIHETAQQNNLDEVELAVVLVQQAIAYDHNMVDNLHRDDAFAPYVTLFTKKGICSSKTILTIALLKELGYSACMLGMKQAEHAAVGILSDKIGINGTHWQYLESTANLPIGILPSRSGGKLGPPINTQSTQAAGLGDPTYALIQPGKAWTGKLKRTLS